METKRREFTARYAIYRSAAGRANLTHVPLWCRVFTAMAVGVFGVHQELADSIKRTMQFFLCPSIDIWCPSIDGLCLRAALPNSHLSQELTQPAKQLFPGIKVKDHTLKRIKFNPEAQTYASGMLRGDRDWVKTPDRAQVRCAPQVNPERDAGGLLDVVLPNYLAACIHGVGPVGCVRNGCPDTSVLSLAAVHCLQFLPDYQAVTRNMRCIFCHIPKEVEAQGVEAWRECVLGKVGRADVLHDMQGPVPCLNAHSCIHPTASW